MSFGLQTNIHKYISFISQNIYRTKNIQLTFAVRIEANIVRIESNFSAVSGTSIRLLRRILQMYPFGLSAYTNDIIRPIIKIKLLVSDVHLIDSCKNQVQGHTFVYNSDGLDIFANIFDPIYPLH